MRALKTEILRLRLLPQRYDVPGVKMWLAKSIAGERERERRNNLERIAGVSETGEGMPGPLARYENNEGSRKDQGKQIAVATVSRR